MQGPPYGGQLSSRHFMIIVGIDPGVTTGMCVFSDGEFSNGGEASGYEGISEYILENDPDVVVVENYVVRRGKPSTYHPPIRTIGVVEFICAQRGIEMVIQSPSILSLSLDKAVAMHKSRHVRSACAHVIYYIKRCEKVDNSKVRSARAHAPKLKNGSSRARDI